MQPISILSPGLKEEAKIVVTGFPGLVIRQDGGLDLCEATLAHEMHRLLEHKVALLIGLIEDEELECVAYDDVIDAAQDILIETARFPLRDYGVPLPGQEASLNRILSKAVDRLRGGNSIALHCMAGDGRSGLLAGCLLVELGFSPARALREVRSVRPQAIETERQLAYLLARSKIPAR